MARKSPSRGDLSASLETATGVGPLRHYGVHTLTRLCLHCVHPSLDFGCGFRAAIGEPTMALLGVRWLSKSTFDEKKDAMELPLP